MAPSMCSRVWKEASFRSRFPENLRSIIGFSVFCSFVIKYAGKLSMIFNNCEIRARDTLKFSATRLYECPGLIVV